MQPEHLLPPAPPVSGPWARTARPSQGAARRGRRTEGPERRTARPARLSPARRESENWGERSEHTETSTRAGRALPPHALQRWGTALAPPPALTQTSHQEPQKHGACCPRASAAQAVASVTYVLQSLAAMQRTTTNTEALAVAEEGSARGRSHGRVNTDSCDPHSYLTGEDSKVQRTKTLVSKIALPLGGHAKAWPRVCLPRSPGSDPTRAHTPLGGQETRSLWL